MFQAQGSEAALANKERSELLIAVAAKDQDIHALQAELREAQNDVVQCRNKLSELKLWAAGRDTAAQAALANAENDTKRVKVVLSDNGLMVW
jgi:chromosome segregation ATPase